MEAMQNSEVIETGSKNKCENEAQNSDSFQENDKETVLPVSEIRKQSKTETVSSVEKIEAEKDVKNMLVGDNDTSDEVLENSTEKENQLKRSQVNATEITENATSLDGSRWDTNESSANKKGRNKTKKSKNYFEIGIPLIGKAMVHKEKKPLTKRYDLAIERNKRRFRFMQRKCWKNGKAGLAAWEIEAKEIFKYKNKSASRKNFENLKLAQNLTKINLKILQELNNNSINGKKIKYYLLKLFNAHVTPTALLYVPHVVHTVSFCRGNPSFSKSLRLMANDCYYNYHAMFPVPMGYNFETVYTSEVGKFLKDPFNNIEGIQLNYGDMSDILSDSENDSDKENVSKV